MTTVGPSPPAEPDPLPWFYKNDEGKSGPVSLTDLCDKIATGVLSDEAPVWRHGLDSWLPASAVPELQRAVAVNRSLAASRAGTRSGLRSHAILAAFGIVAAILAWKFAAWLLGFMAVADVTGTVTAASRPVTGGSVILSPIGEGRNDAPGKPGIATILPDGRYALRITPGGGGLAKRYIVRYAPPVLPPLSEAEAMKAVPPYCGFVPKMAEIAIKPGANAIDIEIVPSSKD